MSLTIAVLLYLVALPLAVSAIGLASSWRLYRRVTVLCLLVWLAGVGAGVLVAKSCAQGDLLKGYSDCGALPDWARHHLTAYGALMMLGALAVYAVMSLAALIRSQFRRDA